MLILFDWCGNCRVLKVIGFIKTLLDIIRFIVPIGLILMTSLDVVKKVIKPDDKEGQKRIMHRLIAAVVVFFAPIFIRFILLAADKITGKDVSSSTSSSACWVNADSRKTCE